MNKKELIKTLNNIYSNENDYKFADGLVNVHSMARIFIELAQQLPDGERGECKFLFYSRNDFRRMVSTFVCTNCEAHILAESTSDIPKCSFKYCPNCGAKIKRGGKNGNK